jgi:hypothetical protein
MQMHLLIDVHFLDYPDKEINELAARGIGEFPCPGSPPPSLLQCTTRPVSMYANCG